MTNDEFRERAEAVKDNPVEMAVLVREQTAELLAGVERRLMTQIISLAATNERLENEVARLRTVVEQARAAGVR